MIHITDKESGFSHKSILNVIGALRGIYEQESPPADKIEIPMEEILWAANTGTIHASVELTTGNRKHISKCKFKMAASDVIDPRTFSYL